MAIHISGKQMETGDALREYVEGRVAEIIAKYFPHNVESADVKITFSKSRIGYHCDIAAHIDSGMHMQAGADEGEVYQSFDRALERLAKQLRRHKRKLTSHSDKHANALPAEQLSAAEISAQFTTGEIPDGAPAIIIERSTDWPVLSIAAAIEILEEGEEYVLFLHQKNADAAPVPSLVHKRNDGMIGWMEVS